MPIIDRARFASREFDLTDEQYVKAYFKLVHIVAVADQLRALPNDHVFANPLSKAILRKMEQLEEIGIPQAANITAKLVLETEFESKQR